MTRFIFLLIGFVVAEITALWHVHAQTNTQIPIPVFTQAGQDVDVNCISGCSGGTSYTEDDASAANPIGSQTIARRRDTLVTETTTDGDSTALNATAKGELYVKQTDPIRINDGTDTALVSGTGSLQVTCDNCGAASPIVDESVFTIGTTAIGPIGFLVDDTTPDSAPEGSTAAARMTLTRKPYAVISGPTGEINATTRDTGSNDSLNVAVVDGSGNQVTSFGGGTEYTTNAVVPADPVGGTLTMERDDSLSALTEIEGDWTNLRANANGALWVKQDGDITATNLDIRDLTAADIVTVTDGAGALNVIVDSGTLVATQSGTWNITNVSGTISLPTGAATLAEQQTQTTALQLIDNLPLGQGSTTSGQSGALVQGATTTSAPTYTTAQTNPLSLQTDGSLRTAVTNTVTVGDGAGALNVIVDSGALTVSDGAGALNVIVDSGTVAATQSGTWTVQPGNTANTTPWLFTVSQGGNTATVSAGGALKVDNSAVTQPVSGTVTANAGSGIFIVGDGTGALTVDGTVNAAQSGTWNITNISGTVSLPTGASTLAEQQSQTTALQLIDNLPVGQGSTTSGQSGVLTQGAVTTAAPSYTTAQTSPLSLQTDGSLRTAVTNTVTVGDGAGALNVIVDSGSVTATVSATDLDIRNLTATDVVTVTDGAGALNVIVDSGTTAATQSGTWNITNISGTISLPTGASTLAEQQTQTTALQKIDNLAHSGSDVALAEHVPISGQLDETGTTTVTENQVAPLRITTARALHVAQQGTVTVTGTVTANAGTGTLATDPTDDDARVLGRAKIHDGTDTALVSGTGSLQVTCDNCSGGTEYVVNAVAPADPTGATFTMERDDALSALSEIEGDWTNPRSSANGALWVAVDGTVTVSATNLDIRDLTATDVVTVTDGAGALNVIVDSGTVAATQSGTWNITNVSGAVSLPTGASTLAEQQTQTTALQKIDNLAHSGVDVALVEHVPFSAQFDDTATTTVTENNLAPLRITSGRALHVAQQGTATISGTVTANAGTGTFTVSDGSGALNVIVDSGTTAVTQGTASSLNAEVQGDAADGAAVSGNPVRIGGKDGSGNTQDITTDTSGDLQVDVLTIPSVTIGTFPDNEPFNLAQLAGNTISSGNGVAGTGTVRVSVASDSTGQTKVTDGTDTALVSGTGSLQVTCDNCGGATPFEDEDAFTVSTSAVAVTGYLVDDTTPDSAPEGSAAAPRMTLTRKPYAVISGPTGEVNATTRDTGSNDSLNVAVVDASGNQVTTFGGETTPTSPATDYVTSASVAAQAEANLDTADLPAKKLTQVTCWSSVAYRLRVFLVNNGVESTEALAIGGGQALMPWTWQPPHRDYGALGTSGGLDAFRSEFTSMDDSRAADAHCVFAYQG